MWGLQLPEGDLLIHNYINRALFGGLFDFGLEAQQIRAFYNCIWAIIDKLKDFWAYGFCKTTGNADVFNPNP